MHAEAKVISADLHEGAAQIYFSNLVPEVNFGYNCCVGLHGKLSTGITDHVSSHFEVKKYCHHFPSQLSVLTKTARSQTL